MDGEHSGQRGNGGKNGNRETEDDTLKEIRIEKSRGIWGFSTEIKRIEVSVE